MIDLAKLKAAVLDEAHRFGENAAAGCITRKELLTLMARLEALEWQETWRKQTNVTVNLQSQLAAKDADLAAVRGGTGGGE